ncbi:MIP/aquaporin family protein [Nodosilinea nodulosa]|uniref:MIP/aquaporin family protein n=1 Tax=Nodosilinea nodulosa TaxID=416001 RepID=UPI000303AE8F|nr:aquaporin [Nodosilinea nodulosa]
MLSSLRRHWPEYAIEAWGLGLFMVSAGGFATLLFYPNSPVYALIPSGGRGVLMGVAMGLTAIAIIYSPWGKRSGAHINPAVTLAFFRLGKLAPWDAFFYVVAQFIGGLVGVWLVAIALQTAFTDRPIDYIVTVPGPWGWPAALLAEFIMAFGLMLMVLVVSNHKRWSQLTGLFAGLMVATYITFAAPISGMSINPARSFASALPAQVWTAFWIYYFAPPLAMLAAVEVYLRWTRANPRHLCGKLCPNVETPCLCTSCCCEADTPMA